MEKKRLNITIDVKGEAGEYLHKAVQNVLFSKGFGWVYNGKVIHNYGDAPLYIEMNTDGTEKKIWQFRESEGKDVKATDILSGAFDLGKWIKDNTSEKDVIYCVDLTWVKGEAREVLSAALQKKAFEKGFGKNTGLGLFLIREILSITGISIIENGEPGIGVRFEIGVPPGKWREMS